MVLPDALAVVTVTGTYVDSAGDPMVGKIRFTPSHVLHDPVQDVVVIPEARVAVLDAEGKFSIQLHATNDPDLTPAGIHYVVQEDFTGSKSGRVFEIVLPHDAEEVDMADIVPVQVGRSPSPAFTLLQIAAMRDVDTAARANGYVLVWNETDGIHEYAPAPTGPGGGGGGTPPILVVLPDSITQYLTVQIPDDGSEPEGWPDRLAFDLAGLVTGRFDRYGQVRSTAAKDDEIAMVAEGRSGSQTADVFQARRADGSVLAGVGYDQANFNVPVSAPNVGSKVTATVVGAPAPENPQIGDIWVRYP